MFFALINRAIFFIVCHFTVKNVFQRFTEGFLNKKKISQTLQNITLNMLMTQQISIF